MAPTQASAVKHQLSHDHKDDQLPEPPQHRQRHQQPVEQPVEDPPGADGRQHPPDPDPTIPGSVAPGKPRPPRRRPRSPRRPRRAARGRRSRSTARRGRLRRAAISARWSAGDMAAGALVGRGGAPAGPSRAGSAGRRRCRVVRGHLHRPLQPGTLSPACGPSLLVSGLSRSRTRSWPWVHGRGAAGPAPVAHRPRPPRLRGDSVGGPVAGRRGSGLGSLATDQVTLGSELGGERCVAGQAQDLELAVGPLA